MPACSAHCGPGKTGTGLAPVADTWSSYQADGGPREAGRVKGLGQLDPLVRVVATGGSRGSSQNLLYVATVALIGRVA